MVFPSNQILNVSPNLQIAIYLKDYSSLPYFFFRWCWVSLLLYYVLPQSGGRIFPYSHLSFTAAYSLKSEKDWPVDFAKLWTRESDSVYNHVS